MKPLIFLSIALSVLLFSNLSPEVGNTGGGEAEKILTRKKMSVVSCAPDWNSMVITDEQAQSMVPLPGTGAHQWKISTKHDSAAFYFNQGMNLYYGFHIIEAIPSLKKAITFDPENPLLYWAEALAYGPNINDLGYAASPDALAATNKAVALSANSGEKEKLLIEAMKQRYSPDSTVKRAWLNKQYADAMGNACRRFPEDAEIATLYADALMLLHPWDLWFHNGQPKPWTLEIVAVLEEVLKKAPDHPGANHYYIHAVEASPQPDRATASANRLGRLTPGLSHMVHMPSHIYIRTGEYEKGAAVNRSAVHQYKNYLQLYPEVAGNAALYDLHNRHMQAVCSMNGKNYSLALKDAQDCRNSFDTSFLSIAAPVGPYVQFVYMMPEFTMIQFERWNEILKEPLISRKDYSGLLQHFARGMAYANTQQLAKAKASLASIETLMDVDGMALPFGPFNAPKEGAIIARELLKATIFDIEGNVNQAQQHFNMAVVNEDALIYNEPKDWVLPVRQFQGWALLRMKSFRTAEKVFREDLRYNPSNLKSVKGLSLATR